MLLSERIAEIEATGASVLVQQKKKVAADKVVVDLYVFHAPVDGVRQTEKVKVFVSNLDEKGEAADYIDKLPAPLVVKDEETPIGTDEQILNATGLKWLNYQIVQKENIAYVTGYASLSAKETVIQNWIVQVEKGALVAYEQK